jgi:hypothetical protein
VQAGWPLQVAVQFPLTQLLPGPQAMPQPPQFWGSLRVLAHPAGQHDCPEPQTGPPLQVAVQLPAEQFSPVGQALPQKPQFWGSLVVSEQPDGQQLWLGAQDGPPLQVGPAHMPITQESPSGQTLPQEPQFSKSLEVSEQPDAQHTWTPVQTGPPWQELTQPLLTHEPPGAQAKPQAPQLPGSLVVSVQPAPQHCSGAVQAGPPWQEPMHIPFTQPAPAGHTRPQKPQLLGSVPRSTQLLEQLVRPFEQPPPMHSPPPELVMQQAPLVQVHPAGQTTPQALQLLSSLLGSTQVVPALQQRSPLGQPVLLHGRPWQTPLAQLPPPGQTLPQVPQLFGSVLVSTSQPSETTPSQSAKPGTQEVIWQLAARQPAVPSGTVDGQKLPQLPQLLGSAVVLAQRAPQQVCPLGQPAGPQGPTHSPPEQASPAGQTFPQAPQFWGSLPVLTSQPSETTPSQSAKPITQPPRAQAPEAQSGRALG